LGKNSAARSVPSGETPPCEANGTHSMLPF
jgi:hypothetical protein